jgi:alkanesulfonate monooxygenase SsuD/methylene tetrahydromethanopterin reductase-like flavin-dependent oxidoreductase (luciferase family)
VAPVLGETKEEAEAKKRRMTSTDAAVAQSLAMISSVTDIDFSQFPLDEPLPELVTNGEQGSLSKFVQAGTNKTLRQLAIDGVAESVPLVGTPDDVAETLGEIMGEVGGDGFLITTPTQSASRRYISEITDGLVPALQRRGLVRTEYTYEHLRDTLTEF